MNLSENLREPIRNRDMATKVDMLCSFKRRQMVSQVNEGYFIEQFLKKLCRVSCQVKHFQCVVITCKSSLKEVSHHFSILKKLA